MLEARGFRPIFSDERNNSRHYASLLENCLRTTLKTRQVLVIDPATFHKRGRISQLIEDAGCQLLYLPPHTPDLNKIEQRRESFFNLFGGAIVNSLDSYPQGKSSTTYPVGISVCLAKSSVHPRDRVCVSPVKSKSDLSLS